MTPEDHDIEDCTPDCFNEKEGTTVKKVTPLTADSSSDDKRRSSLSAEARAEKMVASLPPHSHKEWCHDHTDFDYCCPTELCRCMNEALVKLVAAEMEAYASERVIEVVKSDSTMSLFVHKRLVEEAVREATKEALEHAAKIVESWTVWTPDHVAKLVEAIRARAAQRDKGTASELK